MLSLLYRRFLLCLFYLYVLRTQRIMGFFQNLDYPQINEVEKSDHMDSNKRRVCTEKREARQVRGQTSQRPGQE